MVFVAPSVASRAALVAGAAFAAVVLLAPAGAATGARRAAASSYTEAQAIRAFKASGIALVDAQVGEENPVVELVTLRPEHGWSLALFVYPRASQATQAYDAGKNEWKPAGFAALAVRNLVVTVVPTGRRVGVKAPPFAVPPEVRAALARLPAR